MGLAIDRSDFTEDEYARFATRLADNLEALKRMLAMPDFGHGPMSIGAELELSVVDEHGDAMPRNQEIAEASGDERLQLELDNFNLEFNLSPVNFTGAPFTKIEREMAEALDGLRKTAATFGGRLAPVGILPTLRGQDLVTSALTDMPRYWALSKGISRLRGAPFEIDINGYEALKTECDSVSLEGANTSYQVHLRVNPDEFADYFNTAQLVTPIALACCCNSPIFLSRFLWAETRIALFKQAIDPRTPDRTEWRRAARVPFGHGWARNGPFELFAEAVRLFPPIIPVTCDEDPLAVLSSGELPALLELRLHQGTIWQWNRPIFDPAAGGHFRIEFRALPSGPTPRDMAANAAFLVGLTVGLKPIINDLLPGFPFHYAEFNFYRAAQRGLDAQLLWPTDAPPCPQAHDAKTLIRQFLPVAKSGLKQLGVAETETHRLLGVIEQRIDSGNTGASWQRETVRKLEAGSNRYDALHAMLGKYLDNVESGKPVGEWTRA